MAPNFKEVVVKRQDGLSLHFYINGLGSDAQGTPLIVWLDGSGCGSQFFLRDGELCNTNYGVLSKMAGSWARVAAPEKRGVPFGYAGHAGSGEKCPEEYSFFMKEVVTHSSPLKAPDKQRAVASVFRIQIFAARADYAAS